MAGKTVAPFRRPLRLGYRGSDVIAVKRAAHRLGGFRTGIRVSPVYGPLIWNWMRRWKKQHGLGSDGSYGRATHQSFVRRNGFDAYGCWLLKSAEWKTVEEKRRDAIVRTALHLVAHRDAISYTQGPGRWSGIDLRIKPPAFPRTGDCSSIATYCYWVADQDVGGVPDPNGLGWRSGFTGTMREHGTRVSNPRPGDLAIYGPGTGRHVVVCIGDGKAVSHGSSSGPLVVRLNYRSDLSEFRDYIGG